MDRDERDEPIEVDCPECGKPGCQCYKIKDDEDEEDVP